MSTTNRIALASSLIFLLLALAPAQAQILTHGPVVGEVTDSTARIFLRTDKATAIAVRWSVDPNLQTLQASDRFTTSATSDFTKIIQLTGLPSETTI